MVDEAANISETGEESLDRQIAFVGLKNHTKINEFTPTGDIDRSVFQTLRTLHGRREADYGAQLLPVYDTLRILSIKEAAHNPHHAGDYARLAADIENILTGVEPVSTPLQFPRELFELAKVQGRLDQFTRANIAKRAQAAGQPTPLTVQEAIPFVYEDMSQRIVDTRARGGASSQENSEARTQTPNDYYQQFPELDVPIGTENFRALLSQYDQIISEVISADHITQGVAEFKVPPEFEQRLEPIRAKVASAVVPSELREQLLSNFLIPHAIRRIFDQTERSKIKNAPETDPYEILGLNEDVRWLDGLDLNSMVESGVMTMENRDRVVQERKKAVENAYLQRAKAFHPDNHERKPFDWERYGGHDAEELMKKINGAHDKLAPKPVSQSPSV